MEAYWGHLSEFLEHFLRMIVFNKLKLDIILALKVTLELCYYLQVRSKFRKVVNYCNLTIQSIEAFQEHWLKSSIGNANLVIFNLITQD